MDSDKTAQGTVIPFRRPPAGAAGRAPRGLPAPPGPAPAARPDPWDLVLLGRARARGTVHVARLVCLLPMAWGGRLSFYDLAPEEEGLVRRHRRLMREKGMCPETVRLVLGASPVEFNMLSKAGHLPLLGSSPPFWATAAWHARAVWPKLYDRAAVMAMAAEGAVPEWRRHRSIRRRFLSGGLAAVV